MFYTVNSIHLTSLAAPRQPKKDTKQTSADVAIKTYVAPANKFVPSSSLTKLRSTTVQMPRPKTTAPPIYKQKQTNDSKVLGNFSS